MLVPANARVVNRDGATDLDCALVLEALIDALPEIGGYGVHASKIRRAGVPILTAHTILRVEGEEGVERATIARVDDAWQAIQGTEQTLEVVIIGLAVGLSPFAELAWMARCQFAHVPELGGWVPVHDEEMKTSLTGLYMAGDATGIEEASIAMEQGWMAGLSAAQALGYLPQEEAELAKTAVRHRLDTLRVGSFGNTRASARKKILSLAKARDE